MYYPADIFQPSHIEDAISCYTDNDDKQSIFSGSSEASAALCKKKKSVVAYQKQDQGHYKLKETRGKNKFGVEFFTTGYTPGTVIRDAVTGSRYPGLLVGSANESLFFKVKLCNQGMSRDAGNLFFFTPDEFERHYKTTLKPSTKERWEKKFQLFQRKRRQAEMQANHV